MAKIKKKQSNEIVRISKLIHQWLTEQLADQDIDHEQKLKLNLIKDFNSNGLHTVLDKLNIRLDSNVLISNKVLRQELIYSIHMLNIHSISPQNNISKSDLLQFRKKIFDWVKDKTRTKYLHRFSSEELISWKNNILKQIQSPCFDCSLFSTSIKKTFDLYPHNRDLLLFNLIDCINKSTILEDLIYKKLSSETKTLDVPKRGATTNGKPNKGDQLKTDKKMTRPPRASNNKASITTTITRCTAKINTQSHEINDEPPSFLTPSPGLLIQNSIFSRMTPSSYIDAHNENQTIVSLSSYLTFDSKDIPAESERNIFSSELDELFDPFSPNESQRNIFGK